MTTESVLCMCFGYVPIFIGGGEGLRVEQWGPVRGANNPSLKDYLSLKVENCISCGESRFSVSGVGPSPLGQVSIWHTRITYHISRARSIVQRSMKSGAQKGAAKALKAAKARRGKTFCANCLTSTDGKLKCGGCSKEKSLDPVYYCNRDCQLSDWKQGGHKKICGQPINFAGQMFR